MNISRDRKVIAYHQCEQALYWDIKSGHYFQYNDGCVPGHSALKKLNKRRMKRLRLGEYNIPIMLCSGYYKNQYDDKIWDHLVDVMIDHVEKYGCYLTLFCQDIDHPECHHWILDPPDHKYGNEALKILVECTKSIPAEITEQFSKIVVATADSNYYVAYNKNSILTESLLNIDENLTGDFYEDLNYREMY